jgi:hypothetical protein
MFAKKRKEIPRATEGSAKDRKATRSNVLHEIMQDGEDDEINKIKVEDLVNETLESGNKLLNLLPEAEMAKALEDFVVRRFTNAITDTVAEALDHMQQKLVSDIPAALVAGEATAHHKAVIAEHAAKVKKDAEERVKRGQRLFKGREDAQRDSDDEDAGEDYDDDEDENVQKKSNNRGAGAGAGRGRKPAAAAAAAAAKPAPTGRGRKPAAKKAEPKSTAGRTASAKGTRQSSRATKSSKASYYEDDDDDDYQSGNGSSADDMEDVYVEEISDDDSVDAHKAAKKAPAKRGAASKAKPAAKAAKSTRTKTSTGPAKRGRDDDGEHDGWAASSKPSQSSRPSTANSQLAPLFRPNYSQMSQNAKRKDAGESSASSANGSKKAHLASGWE